MYPVTAGSGHAGASATANLRHGSFVFGFFLDGADHQVPIIMGVLGNNIQTTLSKRIGTTEANFAATSGFVSNDPLVRVPDSVKSLDPLPNPAIEDPSNPHVANAADAMRHDLMSEKISLISPCDKVGSALKAIQDKLEWLVKKINKYLNQAQSYVDIATGFISEIQSIISNAACFIAKYVKILFDKISEYMLKTINKALAPTIETLPPNKRQYFILIKDSISELINCLYNKMINNLCGTIEKYLNKKLDILNLPQPTSNVPYVQTVPSCAVEDFVGSIMASNMPDIDQSVNDILNIVNGYLGDVQAELAAIGGSISNINSFVKGFEGNILSALSFDNLKLNVFGCDLKPKCPNIDHYTLHSGGLVNIEKASLSGISNSINKTIQTEKQIIKSASILPYTGPK
jgi:hypothetical protein